MGRTTSRLALSLALLLGVAGSGCSVVDTDDPGIDDVVPVEIPLDEAAFDQEVSLARNIYFVFDGSGSMGEELGRGCRGDRRFGDKLQGAKWALEEFMNKVPPDVNVGLYAFDETGREERAPLRAGRQEDFLQAVQQIRAGGGTPLAEAIVFATDRLVDQYKQQLGYGEYRVVVVTDGLAEGIPTAVRYATQYGMPIYAIGLCIGQKHPLRKYAVSYRAADSVQDLRQGLEETLAELPSFDPAEFEKDAG